MVTSTGTIEPTTAFVHSPSLKMVTELFTYRNLYRTYRACRKNKRNKKVALEFEVNAEENLLDLQQELRSRTYEPSSFDCFITKKPKHREIFVPPFRDRVVHHLIVYHLEPIWEKIFISDSYACRRGKGTHKAVYRLQSFMRKSTANGRKQAYFLHIDIGHILSALIKPFFMIFS